MFGLKVGKKQPSLGEWGEEHIAGLYRSRGFKILDKNFYNRKGKRLGEIDLVAAKDKLLVFVEVKTRVSLRFGTPAEAVDVFKQRRLLAACKYFLAQNPEFSEHVCRIDVAEVLADVDKNPKSVNIIENAIEDNR
ncbi:MAG: YraN family protein [Patescibacteria group bacterium]|nr:YraN family protein [Patescibacteria group bacterium]